MIGKYPAKLDEKSRLFVPSKLRGELGETFFVPQGVNCGHRCRHHYNPAEWHRLYDNIKDPTHYPRAHRSCCNTRALTGRS